jgi:DNA repair protein RecN (Recombination protein N)
MLAELIVENYAVIERVRVRFGPGLNLLTGETGSGKSILVDSMALLFGGRASAEMVRGGADRARIAAIFEPAVTPDLAALLEENSLELEDGELLIEREVLANGKSRAFAGGRAVTAAVLRGLAPHLGDIHGQHDQQRLFSAAAQLEILDGFAGVAREEIRGLHGEWLAAGRELERWRESEAEQLRLRDLWAFQKKEIEAVAPQPGEDEALEAERRILLNVTRLQEQAQSAYEALYEAEVSALGLLGQARKRVEELARIDASQAGTAALLEPAYAAIEEAAHALRDYLGRLDADPARVDGVESRLAALERLKRKYGPGLDRVLEFGAEVSAKFAAAEDSEGRRACLEKRLSRAAEAYEALAAKLTRQRKAAAARLEKAVQEELKALAMGGTRFMVEFGAGPWTEAGADHIRFLIAPNAGEEAKPLDRIASGGELSRLALALKTCVEAGGAGLGGPVRTLVFDEVDTGIGGAVAEAVGRRLKKLAAANQVLCVTHLAQVASFADRHFVVEKREVRGRTAAEVEELSGEARTREIARMLSGQKMTPEALKHAEKLVRMSTV